MAEEWRDETIPGPQWCDACRRRAYAVVISVDPDLAPTEFRCTDCYLETEDAVKEMYKNHGR